MHDSELIRRYTLDRAGIMFVTDLIWDTLTSPTPRRNAIAPEIEGNPYFNVFGNWKNTTMQQRWFLYLTARSVFVFSSLRVALRLVLNHFWAKT